LVSIYVFLLAKSVSFVSMMASLASLAFDSSFSLASLRTFFCSCYINR
jgi:hypothetical protein